MQQIHSETMVFKVPGEIALCQHAEQGWRTQDGGDGKPGQSLAHKKGKGCARTTQSDPTQCLDQLSFILTVLVHLTNWLMHSSAKLGGWGTFFRLRVTLSSW